MLASRLRPISKGPRPLRSPFRRLGRRIGYRRTIEESVDVLDLGSVTTTGDTNADVELGELVETHDEQGLVDLNYGHLSASISHFHVDEISPCDLSSSCRFLQPISCRRY